MRVLLALVLVALAGCKSTPVDRPFAPGEIGIDIVDREAGTGEIRIALENRTRRGISFLCPYTLGSKSPVAGERKPYPWSGDGSPSVCTLGARQRTVLDLGCPAGGFCRYVDNHLGLYVCRSGASSDCADYEILWTPTTIAEAPGGVALFDVHLHGGPDPSARLAAARDAGVGSIALSTSWDEQQAYLGKPGADVLPGLMFPCPQGKVPYSLQPCFADGRDWPGVEWTEAQVAADRIRFLGEILTPYYGIAPDDPRMEPYWRLAEEHDLPVGIHTGSAGPGHGSPAFREELGDPALLRPVLDRHPTLRLWIMHAGAPHFASTMALLRDYPNVHVDISVLNNPEIVPPQAFAAMMSEMLAAGFGDRIMYGSDNADIETTRASLDALGLGDAQLRAILHDNAARFFERR